MIDWKGIWQTHAPYFKDGVSKIPLRNGKFISLAPGPGFGDLSHPTTSLCLSFLSELDPPQNCVDIGTGSGILAIGAALLGAKKVYAYEIDPDSIEHAKANISLNNLDDVIVLNTPSPPKEFDLLLLNMISSEQRVALDSYAFLDRCDHTRIVSGVLTEQDGEYQNNFSQGRLEEKRNDRGWMGYRYFHQRNQCL